MLNNEGEAERNSLGLTFITSFSSISSFMLVNENSLLSRIPKPVSSLQDCSTRAFEGGFSHLTLSQGNPLADDSHAQKSNHEKGLYIFLNKTDENRRAAHSQGGMEEYRIHRMEVECINSLTVLTESCSFVLEDQRLG